MDASVGQRRSRRYAKPRGRNVEITPRRLDGLKFIYRHGQVRSSHFCDFIGGNKTASLNVLTDLRHERPHTLHCPEAQWDYGRLHRDLLYRLAPRGLSILREAGYLADSDPQWVREGKYHADLQLRHRLMISDVSSLIDIELKAYPTITLHPWSEIVCAAPMEARTAENPLRIPVDISYRFADGLHTARTGCIPDGIFSLEYGRPGGALYNGFFIEANLRVEVSRKNLRQSSLLKKFLAYEDILNRRKTEAQFGMAQPFRVLNVFDNESRMTRSIELLREAVDQRWHKRFLFKTDPALGNPHRTPRPNETSMLLGWLRGDEGTFDLTKPEGR